MTPLSIVGSYPPNYGGISTHVQRLHHCLAPSHAVTVFDFYAGPDDTDAPGLVRLRGHKLRRAWQLRRALAARQDRIAHFHVSAMRKFLWATPILLGRRGVDGACRRILTIHGGAFPQVVGALSRWERPLFRWMLRQFDHFICVSDKQRAVLDEWRVAAERISVINAYLPPLREVDTVALAPLHAARERGQPIIVCSAQYIEHYGLIELLTALRQLRERGEPVPLLALITYLDVIEDYRARCQALLAETEVYAVDNIAPPAVAAILSLGDIFVRPTWWDGDAVSVREAAFFGNRIVATDVTTRPPGTLLCAARDADSLAAALRTALAEPGRGRVSFDHEASQRELLALYRALDPAHSAQRAQPAPEASQ